MTVDMHQYRTSTSSAATGGGGAAAGLVSSKSMGSGRMPLQSRSLNTIGSNAVSMGGKVNYGSVGLKDSSLAPRGVPLTLESSNNENNKRISSSSSSLSNQNGTGQHVRRSSDPDGKAASTLLAPKATMTRSNSVPISSPTDSEDVIIEEKRKRASGDGYTLHRYLRGRLLGKGGFAKVYLCTALDTNKTYAVKIVPKANLVKARARQKLQAEIKIHRTLKHRHVCEYKHFFEDRQNCYILLELCHNQSMNEMIKRRKKLTEPETAYLMKQLLEAVKYMHDNFVIHRDLKLGNLFLDRNLNIKVGDLGLATRVDSAEEKRKTICGTPNYIAPEVIQGDRATRGHSFEVDIWSMGVILYTSLVGKPPYEAKDVKATYQRILANEYSFPHDAQLSDNAKDLIRNMLQSKPLDRPSLDDIAAHPFLNESPVPFALPSNATHVAPVWKMNDFGELIAVSKSDLEPSSTSSDMKPNIPRSSSQSRRPLSARDVNADRYSDQAKPSNHSKIIQNTYDVPGVVKHVVSSVMGMSGRLTPTSNTPRNGGFEVFDESTALSESRKNAIASSSQKPVQSRQTEDDLVARTAALSLRTQEPSTYSSSTPSPRDPPASSAVNHNMAGENDAILLHQMVDRISTVLDITANRKYSPTQSKSLSLAPFSAGGPTKWVSRYVDYTSKYGLGFLLNDGSSGVYFNDSTKTVLEANGDGFQYIERRRLPTEGPNTKGGPMIQAHSLSDYPDSLQKKVTLLKHFRNYLIEQQKKSCDDGVVLGSSSPSSTRRASSLGMVYLKKWVRTKHAIFFRLSDSTVQIVFYDHTEVLLTDDERHMTYVDKDKNRKTYYLTDELVGCNPEIAKRLKYTKEILQQLVGASPNH